MIFEVHYDSTLKSKLPSHTKNGNLLASQLFIAKTSPEMEFWKSTLIIKPLGNTMMIDCI